MKNEETVIKIDGILRQNEQDTERKEAFLPTDCVQNHAANLLELDNGDVLCVWFGGTQEEYLISQSICRDSNEEVTSGQRQ